MWLKNESGKGIYMEELYQERMELAVARIQEIREELTRRIETLKVKKSADPLEPKPGDDLSESKQAVASEAEYLSFFESAARFLVLMMEQWDFVSTGAIRTASLEELQKRNEQVYYDVLPAQYEKSYVNPDVAADIFGQEMGKVLCVLMAELRGMIGCVYEGDAEGTLIRLELFLECYQSYCSEPSGFRPSCVRDILYWYVSDYSETRMELRIKTQVDPSYDFAQKIIMESDLKDPRFLYLYGEYVSPAALRTLAFLNEQTPERLELMAKTFTEGYRIGFATTGRDISIKNSVNIRYALGFEPMIRIAIRNFEEIGLATTMYRAGSSLFYGHSVDKNGFFGSNPNKQFDFDHREDLALLLDGQLVNRKLECLKAGYESYKAMAKTFGGPAVQEIFGEEDFEPVTKQTAPAYSKEQQKLCVEYASKAGQITNTYIPGEERSFTIIAFPVPEIGEQFEAIFDETITINTLDYTLYQGIQQKIIDALDQGTDVIVKGCGENRTNLNIHLHELNNPDKETNFENCVADVNIPVGEVFTSPVLKGTTGILHVTSVFLEGLEYKDLFIELKDGMVADYGCSNFADKEASRKLMNDNILAHHDTVPIGEFAIGTNTTAFVMAGKFGIESKMPILIAEKTGPHFAFGDTCYSHSEEVPMFNPDGKRMIAVDNECSILRDEAPEKAYFNCHTDITIPYNELGELSVLCKDGEKLPIILNGRFVLDGTEVLNKPLEEQ